MKSVYNVLINGGYVNSFKSYVKACELRDQLERQFKKSAIIKTNFKPGLEHVKIIIDNKEQDEDDTKKETIINIRESEKICEK